MRRSCIMIYTYISGIESRWGGNIFRTRPDRPWGPPSRLCNGYRVFPGGKAAGAWRWPLTPFECRGQEGVELYLYRGPDSSVGIATELWAGRSGIESRWGRDFPSVQTSPEAHPASCTMDIGSFPGLEAAGAWGWPPPPSSAEILERVDLYLYSP